MFEIKANALTHFQLTWNTEQNLFNKPQDNWQKHRDKLVNALPGIGYAKTSFALEMIYPNEAECLCLDRHMLKAFGFTDVNSTVSKEQYYHYENYWLDHAKAFRVPAVISRNIFWDQIQNQTNSLYWASSLL
ncbi:MAG: hypothetical protein CL532_01545 [Aestuariivita sp.]|nr:hypothetical protein [Aestuariivita sp.]|tara:strand:+ start:6246 stop:6641 length:396 start_codon:yes stop_codon:yes gene_type:complete